MNIKKLEQIAKDSSTIGLTCLITDNKEIKDYYTYGYQDIKNNKKTSLDTIYRIASISKIEVAIGIMMLVEIGLVNIYDDVSKYLGFKLRNPNFEEDIITIEMIMTQTSSINDCDELCEGYDKVNGPSYYVDLERMLTDKTYEHYSDKTFMNYHPGQIFNYSNFGCGILACIIERVTGEYFTDYIKHNLFDKLSLDASFRVDDIKNKDMIASLYKNEEEVYRTKDMFLDNMFPRYKIGDNFRGPAGGLFISPRDLSKIMIVLMNKGIYNGIRILKEQTVEEMMKIHFMTLHKDGMYKQKGLQMIILDDYDEKLYGHTGYAYGLRSFMLFNENHGYIFMCNGANYKMEKPDFSSIQDEFLKEMIYEANNNR